MGNDLDDLKSTVARAAMTMRTWRGTSILLPAQDERELAAEVIRQEINEIVSALELISDFLVLLKGLGPPSEIAPEDWAMWHTKLVAGLRLMGREVYHGLYTVKEALEVWGSRPPLSSPLLADLKRHCAFRATIVHRRKIGVRTAPIVMLLRNNEGARIDFIRIGVGEADVRELNRLWAISQNVIPPDAVGEQNIYERLRILTENSELLPSRSRSTLGHMHRRYGAPPVEVHALADFVLAIAEDLAPKLSAEESSDN